MYWVILSSTLYNQHLSVKGQLPPVTTCVMIIEILEQKYFYCSSENYFMIVMRTTGVTLSHQTGVISCSCEVKHN